MSISKRFNLMTDAKFVKLTFIKCEYFGGYLENPEEEEEFDRDGFTQVRLRRVVETKIVEVYGHDDAGSPDEFGMQFGMHRSLNDSRLHVGELTIFKDRMPLGDSAYCYIVLDSARWIHPLEMTVIS